jgi:hypothetical protein
MHERLELGGHVEITGLLPQGEVLHKTGAGSDMLAQLLELVGQEGEISEGVCNSKHQNKRRENALDPVGIELGKAEVSPGKTAEDDAGNQKSGNDEENIYTDETAGHAR